MQVREIMTENPTCCPQDTNLQTIAALMKNEDCGEIPIVDDQQRPVGVITDRDIVCRVVAEGKDPASVSARDVMSDPVITVNPDMSLEDCLQAMEKNRIRRVPVVDAKNACCGIVAQADIARHASRSRSGEVVQNVSRV